jgi:2-polyprenyl-3-methyl-5-hydroxy-6-metoxy-1,4-benzoquinol methylase
MAGSNPFDDIGFEDFRRLAQQPGLSKYERIGFPDSYRQGYEAAIFRDIRTKLTQLEGRGRRVLDVGPGCSDLPMMLVGHCRTQGHELHLLDSAEMLAHLPDGAGVHKHAAMFPNCPEFLRAHAGGFDVVLCYSVLHYVLVDVAFFRFLDQALALLAPGGQFLIGDIPNVSKRKRFLASDGGIRFNKQFMQTGHAPEVRFNCIEHDRIDDAIVMALLQRARLQGFDAYVLPQAADLPMANRREDLLIVRP